jgi:nitric oxide synthase oxygenase domain/subunit
MPAVKIATGNGTERIYNRESAVSRGIDSRLNNKDQREINARGRNIRTMLRKIHDEECPGSLLTAFRVYWPRMRAMTMKEAWLRVVYMEAIAGHPWASYFIADHDEGRVADQGHGGENQGIILEAIEKMMENPV